MNTQFLEFFNLIKVTFPSIFSFLSIFQNIAQIPLFVFWYTTKHIIRINIAKNETPMRAGKQKKLVDVLGIVTHNLSNGKFRVKLENGVLVIGHLSGKIRQNRIKIVVGDSVTVELSPYDLTKGRITFRHR